MKVSRFSLIFQDSSGRETHKEFRLTTPLLLASELIRRWNDLEFSTVLIRMDKDNHFGKNIYTFPSEGVYDGTVSTAYNDIVTNLSERM